MSYIIKSNIRLEFRCGDRLTVLISFNFCFVGNCRVIFDAGLRLIESGEMQFLANNTLSDIVPRYYMVGAGIFLSQPLTAASEYKYITAGDEPWPPLTISSLPHPRRFTRCLIISAETTSPISGFVRFPHMLLVSISHHRVRFYGLD